MSHEPLQTSQFCWNELITPDSKKAKEFYCALLGWETQDHTHNGMTYMMFKQGDQNKGGLVQIPPNQERSIPSHWMSYIGVDHLENTLEKAQSLGATIHVPITPVEGFGRFAILLDPTGASIALWQPFSSSE